jgi:hypothetical protein
MVTGNITSNGSPVITSRQTGSFVSTGSFATTGSNTFIGNQVVSGSVTVTGSFYLPNTSLGGIPGFSGSQGQMLFGRNGDQYVIFVWLDGEWKKSALT